MRIKEKAAHAGHRTFKLMAQGDSWFDYPPGSDIAVCLHKFHGHVFSGAHGAVTNLAVAGSTLNDEAYGPVPVNLWGIPQSDDTEHLRAIFAPEHYPSRDEPARFWLPLSAPNGWFLSQHDRPNQRAARAVHYRQATFEIKRRATASKGSH